MDDCTHAWKSVGSIHRITGIASETRHANVCDHCGALGVRRRVSNRKSQIFPLSEASAWYSAAAWSAERSKELARFLEENE